MVTILADNLTPYQERWLADCLSDCRLDGTVLDTARAEDLSAGPLPNLVVAIGSGAASVVRRWLRRQPLLPYLIIPGTIADFIGITPGLDLFLINRPERERLQDVLQQAARQQQVARNVAAAMPRRILLGSPDELYAWLREHQARVFTCQLTPQVEVGIYKTFVKPSKHYSVELTVGELQNMAMLNHLLKARIIAVKDSYGTKHLLDTDA